MYRTAVGLRDKGAVIPEAQIPPQKIRNLASSYLKTETGGGWETLSSIYFIPMSIPMLIYICWYAHTHIQPILMLYLLG